MEIHIAENPGQLGALAAEKAGRLLRETVLSKGHANLILATGSSQFATLECLVRDPSIDWNKVSMFHLDEYIGIPESHPASFRKYLKEKFIHKVKNLGAANLIHSDEDPVNECRRQSELIKAHPIDLALVGIGENGHLAFNDPPADFNTDEPYIIVSLDEACRNQQLHEGWFQRLEQVPMQAISMSIRQIMKSKTIICSVPEKRKAEAVKNSVKNEVSPLFPASILQQHPSCYLYLDKNSASML